MIRVMAPLRPLQPPEPSHANAQAAGAAPVAAATSPRTAALLGSATFLTETFHYPIDRLSAAEVVLEQLVFWGVHILSAWITLQLVSHAFARAAPAHLPKLRRLVHAVLLAAVLASLPGLALLGVQMLAGRWPVEWLSEHPGRLLTALFLRYASLAGLVALALGAIARSRAAQQDWQDAQLHAAGLERETAQARAQLLQAQSEPHFIFNALANVRRLLRTDPAAARGMLGDLLHYLDEALPSLRAGTATLGRETALVLAYLRVHEVRMGPRLQWEVDVPPELAACTVPSPVLLTLVENSLKHGLRPEVDGGSVRVAARADAGRLILTVSDTGRGMGEGSGHGTGLANLRARLRLRYGAAASLSLAVNEPRGVVATVTLPESA